MTDSDDPAAIVEIHERTEHLPDFERFAERIRLLFALPRTYLTSIDPLTEAQARSLAFATRPADIEYYCKELYSMIPDRAAQACQAAGETRPLGWLRLLGEIFVWGRVNCIDTTEWIDERHDRPRPIHFRLGNWVDHRLFDSADALGTIY
jgi:hypothetical protein